MTDLNRAMLVNWLVNRIGGALIVLGGAPLVAALIALVADEPGLLWIGAAGPLLAGVYLVSVGFPPLEQVDD